MRYADMPIKYSKIRQPSRGAYFLENGLYNDVGSFAINADYTTIPVSIYSPGFRHSNACVVNFFDGHVQIVNANKMPLNPRHTTQAENTYFWKAWIAPDKVNAAADAIFN